MRKLTGNQSTKIMLHCVTELRKGIFDRRSPSNRHERRAMAKLRRR